jgi:RNA polymerase sigma-70 factor (ECF subfamily)
MEPAESLSQDFERESATLRRIARGILLEPALAEDAVQEAWLAALRRGRVAASGGWLNEAVRRIAFGLRRREARQARRERAGAKDERLASAADTAARLELLRELLEALRGLDEPYRTAVQMRLVDDLPPREIAERTGVPVETARTRVKRGVERLRAQLDAGHAGRRAAFLGLLAPLAGFDPSSAVLSTLLGGKAVGGTILGVQAKLCVAAVLCAAVGVFFWRPWEAASAVSSDETCVASPDVVLEAPAEAQLSTKRDPSTALASAREELASAGEAPTSAGGAWVVRGKVLDAKRGPLAGIEVRARVVAGYEGAGAELGEQRARSGDDGAFALAFEPPVSAVRVVADVASSGYIDFQREVLVLRDAAPPQEFVLTCYPADVVVRGRVLDPERRPVEGAGVQSHADAARTDGQGHFEVRTSSVFAESFVTAWCDGFAERRTTVQVTEPAQVIEGVELVLRAQGLLRGRVVGESGRAVPGAELSCFSLERVKATSGSGGEFELRGLPLDETWLGVSVSAAGFAPERIELEDGRIPSEELEVVLRRGLEIAGVVVDDAGRPLPGARVSFGRSQFDADSVRCVAGDEGRFVLQSAPRSKGALLVEVADFAPYSMQLDLRDAQRAASHHVVMQRGGTLIGRVVDEHGGPLAGVSVALRTRENYLDTSARTDDAGAFQLTRVPDRPGLQLECYGARRVRTTVDVAFGATAIVVTMAPAAGICGRVVDALTGEPVSSFRVRFVDAALLPGDESLSGIGATWMLEGHEFRAQDGHWSTVGEELSAGMVAGVEVRASGYGTAVVPRAVATLDPEAAPIEVALSAPARVTGRVSDAHTRLPVAGALVRRVAVRQSSGGYFSRDAGEQAQTTTNALGEFAFPELATESMWLVVDAAGYARVVDGSFEPGAGTAHRSIELERGATLRGVLRDGHGSARAGESVRVSTVDATTKEHRDWRIVTDGEGRFELADLARGKYAAALEVRRESHGIFDLSRDVEVRDSGVYEVELRPDGTGRIEGVVNAARIFNGTVSAMFVDSTGAATTHWRIAFVDDNHFVLEGLRPGRWDLSVHEHGGLQLARFGSAAIELAEGATAHARIDVLER